MLPSAAVDAARTACDWSAGSRSDGRKRVQLALTADYSRVALGAQAARESDVEAPGNSPRTRVPALRGCGVRRGGSEMISRPSAPSGRAVALRERGIFLSDLSLSLLM